MITTETAGAVVVNKNGDVLVVSQNGNSWSLPKGHIDAGESALEAAGREIREESGITSLEFVKELGSYERFRIGKDSAEDDTNELKRIRIFLFKTDQEELAPSDPANPEARWLSKAEVVSILTHPKDKDFYKSVMQEL